MVDTTGNTIGAALNAIGAIGKVKLSDADKAKLARERGSKSLHAVLTDAQYAVALDIIDTAEMRTEFTAGWAADMDAYIVAMYTDADKPGLLHAIKGKRHIDTVGKGLADMSGTSWARTAYRAAMQRFLFGDDKSKKLPGARRTKKLAPSDVARFTLQARDRIAEYVKRIDRQDINAVDLKRVTEALGTISNAVSVIRKACGK